MELTDEKLAFGTAERRWAGVVEGAWVKKSASELKVTLVEHSEKMVKAVVWE